jgi:hypothetical protein
MSEEKKSFWQKIFSCCMSKPVEDNTEINSRGPKAQSNLFSDIKDKIEEKIDDAFSIFKSKYIRQDEYGKIKFTEEGILSFIKEVENYEYTQKYAKDEITLSLSDKSSINDQFNVFKIDIVKSKNLFNNVPTIKEIEKALFDPNERILWDKNYKTIEILEKISENADIIRFVSYKQMAIISEREMIEKRYCFYDNDILYNFQTSIPDELYPPQNEPVRVLDYIAISSVREDENNFYFEVISQGDVKSNFPQAMMIVSMPVKLKEFYDRLVKYFNEKN